MPLSIKRKAVLLGDGGVGKTSLVRRFVLNSFDDKYLVTIGTKVSKKVVRLEHPSNKTAVDLTLAIWDIMGHMGVTSVQTDYMHGAGGALVVADVTRRSTLDSTLKWAHALRKEGEDIPIMLLANKSDLIGKEEMGVELCEFGEGELEEFAQANGFECAMTSAKSGVNVESAFVKLSEMMLLRP